MLAEENLPNLLQGICDKLIDKSINLSAWIVLIDKNTGNTLTAEAGLGNYFTPVLNQLKNGIIPSCGKKVIGQKSGVAALCTNCTCDACLCHENKPDGTPVSLSIRCRPDLQGFLVCQPPAGITPDKEELAELALLSQSIGIALHKIISAVESKQKEEELRRLEERFDLALHASQAGLWDWNIKTGEMHTNPNRTKILDYRKNIEKEGPAPWEGLIHPDDKIKVLALLNNHLAGEINEYRIEYRVKGKDGKWQWFLDKGKVVERDELNMPVRMTGTHQNITGQKERDESLAMVQQQLHETLKGERTFLQSIIDGANDPVIAIDMDYNILLINATAAQIMGVNSKESRQQKCYKVFHKSDAPCTDIRFPCPIKKIKQSGKPVTMLHNPLHGNGINNTFELEVSPLKDQKNKLTGIIEIARDISDRLRIEEELKESKSRLYKLAHHDTLTGLPNRLLFRDRLIQAVAKAQRNKNFIAILFMDLDKFKQINDTLGHDTGDQLLIEASRRLRSQCRKSDTVARLGGDEFIFMLDDINEPKDAARIAKKIMAALTLPMQIEGHQLFISTSIGIAIYPIDSDDIDQVIKCADIALYQAKDAGRNSYKFYKQEMYVDEYPVPLLEIQLPDALHMEQFIIEYQPQFDMYSRKLIGLEALLRWNHPEHGIIPPKDFIGIAEDAGLIGAIGKWVLQEVCDQIDAWKLANLEPVPVTINVTLEQILDPDFIPLISQLIQNYNLTPELIEIELAESSISEDLEETIFNLKQISRFGIRLAIDNFGTGDKGLDYLKRFPLDRLKIDHSLIRNIVHDKYMARIVSVIILLANNLGITVLAEGIEQEDQITFLKELNCEQIQGFLLAKPQSAADIEKILSPAK
jgi:diguanylate cyclase (GGDEF)-like protein/PAS domain S-box-containing protein